MEAGLQILGGLLLLAVGGEALIRGAVGIARRFGLSEMLIGLVLVGFGTSAPELITSINAARSGASGIAIGNVVGSNIGNVLLVLGVVVLIRPIRVNPAAVGRDGTVAIVAAVLLAAIALALGELSRVTGVVLTLLLLAYIAVVWRLERNGGAAAELHVEESHTHDPTPRPVTMLIVFTVAGLGMLLFGADLLVRGAVTLARLAGMSETVIGLTIVAVGTSLPELVATLTAALRGRADVAFGNIVGSNIYNVFGILGITALVQPITIPADVSLVDWAVLVGSAVLLMIVARSGKRITRIEGGILVALYAAYVAYLVV